MVADGDRLVAGERAATVSPSLHQLFRHRVHDGGIPADWAIQPHDQNGAARKQSALHLHLSQLHEYVDRAGTGDRRHYFAGLAATTWHVHGATGNALSFPDRWVVIPLCGVVASAAQPC